MKERSEKQLRYLELAKIETVLDEDDEGWMLVSYRPEDEIIAVVAEIEHDTGRQVNVIDEAVWVDRDGCEHFGPYESGYDRFNLREEN